MPPPDQLLTVLSRLGLARAKDLARELGVAQPTISRLLKAAGDGVCRMGQGRATRYARTRSLPGIGARVPIYRVQETGSVTQQGELHLLERGGHWLSTAKGTGTHFVGVPPFVVDMRPQGFVGRTFNARYPELDLPPHTHDWNDDHCLIALARRGEDCVGDLILGEESLSRWFESSPALSSSSAYPEFARRAAWEQPGSSAGGEQPKFLTCAEGRHVLVKYAGGEGAADHRWRDLLVCESLALEEVRSARVEAARARWFDDGGFRFLEVERFDRIGLRGRRGVISLRALDNEYFGSENSWAGIAPKLLAAQRIRPEDERRIRWLDVFGQLIGNSDRHFGNLSFLVDESGSSLRLAPVYDMLPMMFAPVGTTLVERQYEPRPPTAKTLDVWADAALHADGFWTRVIGCEALSEGFRERARQCRDALARLRERVPL